MVRQDLKNSMMEVDCSCHLQTASWVEAWKLLEDGLLAVKMPLENHRCDFKEMELC